MGRRNEHWELAQWRASSLSPLWLLPDGQLYCVSNLFSGLLMLEDKSEIKHLGQNISPSWISGTGKVLSASFVSELLNTHAHAHEAPPSPDLLAPPDLPELSTVWHNTIEGFLIGSKADVLLVVLGFFHDPASIAIWSLGPQTVLTGGLDFWQFLFEGQLYHFVRS